MVKHATRLSGWIATYGPITAVNEEGLISKDMMYNAGASSRPFQQNAASEISTSSVVELYLELISRSPGPRGKKAEARSTDTAFSRLNLNELADDVSEPVNGLSPTPSTRSSFSRSCTLPRHLNMETRAGVPWIKRKRGSREMRRSAKDAKSVWKVSGVP